MWRCRFAADSGRGAGLRFGPRPVRRSRRTCRRAVWRRDRRLGDGFWRDLRDGWHLRRNGWIVSLRRGLYALASTVPGVTPAHEFEIAMALVEPAAISHWSATQ